MAHNYIIQWNCRGLRNNREDIELLISKYSPAAICLQETMLTPHQTQTFKHYSAYYKSGIHGHGGVCILVKDKFIHSQVQFQAVSTANMASQTENGNTSGPYASVSPQLLRAQRPTDAPSYIYRQSPTPKKKVELNRKGPSSIPVTSPITKSAELRNHRKNTAKQTKA